MNDQLEPMTKDFYRRVMMRLQSEQIPFLVGGAYAYAVYTGIERHTKDFDLFVRRSDVQRILDMFTADGLRTEFTYPHWIGKVHGEGGAFVDIIYGAGNGVAVVDDEWFAHAHALTVFDLQVAVCPPEEIIWSKAFVMERERFDGADIAHLLLGYGDKLDWTRLLRRFGAHWRVLYAHLILFGFIYPSQRGSVPAHVMRDLTQLALDETDAGPDQDTVCNGTLLSRSQYLTDLGLRGYADARLQPRGTMTPEDVAYWTAAIIKDGTI